MIGLVVLAAGQASRMGLPKLLLPLQGRSLVRFTIERLLESPVQTTVVVLGAHADLVRDELADLPVAFAVNERYAEGQSTSLRAGLSALPADAEAVVFALADQPLVTADVVRSLVERYTATGRPIVYPTYAGQQGTPVLFARALFPEIHALTGDVGARQVIRRHPDAAVEVPFPSAEPLRDVDTWEDYAAVRRVLGDDPHGQAPSALYCPHCGTALAWKLVEHRPRPACPRCGTVVYEDPKVAVVALIEQDGQLLVAQRAHDPGRGLWSFPGGFVDRGEELERALRREIMEETGLRIALDGLVGVYSQPGHPVVLVAYRARPVGGTLRPSHEAEQLAFFPADALPELAFGADARLLADWRRERAGQGSGSAGKGAFGPLGNPRGDGMGSAALAACERDASAAARSLRVRTLPARQIGPELLGAVLATDVALSRGHRARKGQRVTGDLLPALAALGDRDLALILPSAEDVHQDDAGRELAAALAGPGILVHGPTAGQMSLRAAHRGLLRVDTARLRRINEIDRIAVFTLFDNQLVEAGQEVAGAKVTALVVPHAPVAAAVALARIAGGVLRVLPLVPRRVGVLVSERMRPGARARFRAVLERKLRFFGCDGATFVDAPTDRSALRAALRALRAGGAEIVLAAGGSWSNPAEPVFAVLEDEGIALERLGLPADPGTFFWIAYDGPRPIVGLPACATLAEATIADLLIAKLIAGERLTRAELASFGLGGLFTRESAFLLPRFPRERPAADAPSADEGERPSR